MRRAFALLLGALLVGVAAMGVVVVAGLHADGLLSMARLGAAMHQALDAMGQIAGSLRRWPGLPIAATFAAGTAAGWVGALWWAHGRLRRGPLLLVDLRKADMPLLEGIRHILGHARPPVGSDAAALRLILAEAGQGRLTMWHRSSTNTLRRVPQRHIRTAVARIGTVNDAWSVESWRAVMLLATEVKALWPNRQDAARGCADRGRTPRVGGKPEPG